MTIGGKISWDAMENPSFEEYKRESCITYLRGHQPPEGITWMWRDWLLTHPCGIFFQKSVPPAFSKQHKAWPFFISFLMFFPCPSFPCPYSLPSGPMHGNGPFPSLWLNDPCWVPSSTFVPFIRAQKFAFLVGSHLVPPKMDSLQKCL